MIANAISFISQPSQPNSQNMFKQKKTRTGPLWHKHVPYSRYSCNKLIKNDKNEDGVIYGHKSFKLREKLVNDINTTNGYIKHRPVGGKREILQSWPTKLQVKGLQIHNKLQIVRDNDFMTNDLSNICLECTLLVDEGEKATGYIKVLVRPYGVISSWITKNKTNLISTWLS